MQTRPLIFILLITLTLVNFAQAQKKSSYTVKREPNTTIKKGKCMFNIKFVGADGTPHTGGVRLIFNNDTLFPKTDAKGTYHDWMAEGKYKIVAFVPYWHEVITDSIVFSKDKIITIRMKFEAKELRHH